MKKGIALVLSLLFLSITTVKAASSCTYQEQAELNGVASQIKATYEVKTGKLDSEDYALPDIFDEDEVIDYSAEYKYLQVSIVNITEDFYVVIKNDQSDIEQKVYYSNTNNGVYSYDWNNLNNVAKLTIEVYSSSKTNCANEKYRVLYLTLPKANKYASLPMCNDIEGFYLCKEFVEFEEPDFNTFEKRVNAYKEGKITNTGEETILSNPFISFVNNNKVLIACVSSLVIVGVVTVIALKKKRRNNR